MPSIKLVENESAKAARYRDITTERLVREEALLSTLPPCILRPERRRLRKPLKELA